MEQVFTIKCRALMVILLFVTLNTGQANSVEYKKAGSKVVLSPGSVAAPITSITWKHNSNLAVEWYGGKVDFYSKFKDRCELNTKTGELTFPGVTLGDSGSYTAEINNRVLTPTEIKVISGVSTPTVSESCDATHCVFTCEGITTDAEQVTYSWWSGNKTKSEIKELRITKEEKDPSFICKMENPVSSENSKEVFNPFITSSPEDPVNDNNGLYGLLILIPVFGVIGFFIYKYWKGSQGSAGADPCSHSARGRDTAWTENLPPLLRRVLPCVTPNTGAAVTPQPSPNPVPEKKPLLNGNKDAVQESFNLETINETDVQVTSLQDQRTDVSTGIINEPETTPETTPETPANQGPPAKPQRSSSFLDARVTPPQDQKTDVSTGNINGPETASETPENQEVPAESPTPSPSGTSDQPDVQVTSPQDQNTDVSTGTNNEPKTTSEKPEDTEAADPPPSDPSSGTSGQPEGEEQSPREVSREANNEPEATPETTPENQGPPAEPQTSPSSSDNVTPLQEEKTDESTKTNDGPATSSEKSVVLKSPPDLEKTPVTPNSEA